MRSAGVIAGAVLLVIGAMSCSAEPAFAQGLARQYSTANIQAGYRLYASQCALCHGGNGDAVAGINLARQQFRQVSTDADIRRTITGGVAAAGMPPFQFRPAELDAIIAYIRSGFDLDGASFAVGDAARGKAIFDGKGGCTACHRIHGRGSRTAPDLSDIGALRKPSAIQRSMLQPAAAMQPINRPVRVVTRDGRVIQGRRLNEDTETVQLITRDGRLVSLLKSDIQDFELGKASDMPSFADRLSTVEVADLLAYLLSLKG
jgi:cytochrome c oxidase cbb3-type subunit III